VVSGNQVELPALHATSAFLRQNWLVVLVVSMLVVVPCFWHHHIEAGDLGSHVYNAWIAQLIAKGQAPGLALVRQWNNVLFDFALVGLGRVMSLPAAEKIIIVAAVLIFFWGAFGLICTIRSRSADAHTVPWFLLPGLAVFAYGYTFQMGFVNYYLSVGLAFVALALLVRTGRKADLSLTWEHCFVVMLVPLIWMGKPLGLFLLMTAGPYIVLTHRLRPSHQLYLFCVAALLLIAIHFFIRFRHWDFIWRDDPRLILDGADQLRLYGDHYALPSHLFEGFFVASLLLDVVRRRHLPRWWQQYLIPLQLYGLAVLATSLLPSFVGVPRHFGEMGVFGFLTERLTSVSAVFACCLLATIKPRTWHWVVVGLLSAFVFFLLYRDTGTIDRMEDQADNLVRTVPAGRRILNYVAQLPGERITNIHLTERACVERCFIYNDYEPLTGQFRIRVRSENGIAMNKQGLYDAVRKGKYVVAERDLPLSEIYQCVPDGTKLCIGELAAGQENGQINRAAALSSNHAP